VASLLSVLGAIQDSRKPAGYLSSGVAAVSGAQRRRGRWCGYARLRLGVGQLLWVTGVVALAVVVWLIARRANPQMIMRPSMTSGPMAADRGP
jgi:hypothetical protein